MIAEQRPRNRFYRSRVDRKIAGVAGGIAQYLTLDPTLVRFGFVIAALVPNLGGLAVLGYALLAILTPERPAGGQETVPNRTIESSRTREIAGLILASFGLLLLADNLGAFQFFDWNRLWPVALIATGLVLIVKRSRN